MPIDYKITHLEKKKKSLLKKMIDGSINTLVIKDPLVIHDPLNKSAVLQKSIEYLHSKKHVFYPAFLTNPRLFGGHI
jgi:hypothetical protein